MKRNDKVSGKVKQTVAELEVYRGPSLFVDLSASNCMIPRHIWWSFKAIYPWEGWLPFDHIW